MAKISVVEREKKRALKCQKYRDQRVKLKATIKDMSLSDEERMQAVTDLQKLPRDSSPVRRRNRCKLCGRPRAYNRLTGLCRLHMRKAVINGFVPGMHKSSW